MGSACSRKCCEMSASNVPQHPLTETVCSSSGSRRSSSSAEAALIMDKQTTVVFRNVGQLYFPQTRVECHYSLTSDHRWSSRDWIGIFKVGWSSVKQYYTYTWALTPEAPAGRTTVDCCAHFPAFFLPQPSAVQYQFVYVDQMGEVCACSRPFTFSAPRPLEELETVREEQDEEDGDEEELLLVVPRAQLLQSQLEERIKEQAGLQQELDEVKMEMESEKEKSKQAQKKWESEREALGEEISKLRENLQHKCGMLKMIEGEHNDVKYTQENLNSELSKLWAEKAECQQRIKDLEGDVQVLTDREEEKHLELDRLKERLKRTSSQMKHDAEKKKLLQEENQAALLEVSGLKERLDSSERSAESLRRELKELSARQGHTLTELHRAQLQVAQLTLQLSEENLVLKEERTNWALEREASRHTAESDKRKLRELSSEVQRMEEWLQEERTEREKLEVELARERDRKKDVHQRLGFMSETKSKADFPSLPCDEQLPETVLTVARSSAEDDESVSVPQLDGTNRAQVAAETHIQSRVVASAADTQEEKQHCDAQAGETEQLILSELVDPVLSGLADSLLW